MKKIICMVLSLIMVLSSTIIILSKEEGAPGYIICESENPIPFAEDKADFLNKVGLFKGRDSGYELEKPVTRAEAITMVLRVIGEEKNVKQSQAIRKFDDVSEEHWAFYNIGYAGYRGCIDGTSETTFDPERGVTGREFVKMLLSAIGYQGITIKDAYEAGIKYELLSDNDSKLAVEAADCQLIRNDVVNICYSALLIENPDGKLLKDILIEKDIVNEQDLNEVIKDMTPVSDEIQDFAWELNSFMPKDENYMFSPISIKMALAMAAVGADGETKDEILKTLKIEDLDKFNELSAQLIKEYSENEDVKLNIANSLWLNIDYYNNVDFRNSFQDTIENYYKADSEKVNNENAVATVNNWVKNKTNDKITKLITDSDFLAYIVNAIYFKGEWAKQFSESATGKAEFTDRNNEKSEIDFMNMTGYFNYYEDDNIQMLKLPYKDRKTSMYIVIPEEMKTNLDKNIENMEQRRVQVSIPKFKTEFNIKLVDTLSQMGIKTAFNEQKADFRNMFTDINDNIFISDVIHKTFINVDENGTEAAAVTGIGFGTTSAPTDEPIIFNANKPFIYFIRDDINGEILFMGEYSFTE